VISAANARARGHGDDAADQANDGQPAREHPVAVDPGNLAAKVQLDLVVS
jgi:hypothetical protein